MKGVVVGNGRVFLLSGLLIALVISVAAWRVRDAATAPMSPGDDALFAVPVPDRASVSAGPPVQDPPSPAASEVSPAQPERKDIFGVRTWQPLPTPGQPEAATPAPIASVQRAPPAPVLPFRFLARIVDTDSGEPTFVLALDTSVLLARVGGELDATYRLESYEHGQLIFLNRPMNIRQNLPLGLTQ